MASVDDYYYLQQKMPEINQLMIQIENLRKDTNKNLEKITFFSHLTTVFSDEINKTITNKYVNIYKMWLEMQTQYYNSQKQKRRKSTGGKENLIMDQLDQIVVL